MLLATSRWSLNPLFSGAIPFIGPQRLEEGQQAAGGLNPLFSGAIPFMRVGKEQSRRGCSRRVSIPFSAGPYLSSIEPEASLAEIAEAKKSQSPFQRGHTFHREHPRPRGCDLPVASQSPFQRGHTFHYIEELEALEDLADESQSPFQRGHTFHVCAFVQGPSHCYHRLNPLFSGAIPFMGTPPAIARRP